MSKLTRSNIAYDLNISPHIVTIDYGDSEVKYVFSSELYGIKFYDKLEENRKSINLSLTKRFGFGIKAHKLADLKLYMAIEKRGFLIYENGVKICRRNDIILDGATVTEMISGKQ